MLVALFCVSKGLPTDHALRDTGDEIEKQLQAGLPVLVYFSEARIDFAGINAVQERELNELKQRYASRTSLDSYADEKEFRSKFTRQLELIVQTHAHFKPERSRESIPASGAAAVELSKRAQSLLGEACEDFEAYIGRMKVGDTLKIQANGKQLIDQNDPAAPAHWDAAFHELLNGGYIKDVGCNGQLFQISTKGFAFLKTMGKAPVGYIAELGGM